MKHKVLGFRSTPKMKRGRVYHGRFTFADVQWTGSNEELMGTFTITAEELADAAESQLLWTDQDVQRGIKPGLQPRPPRQLCLAAGYPDPNKYIFRAANTDEITEKLLGAETLFLSPLIWNLRPGSFEAYWDDKRGDLYLYSGRIYLPDSHHRQQAILKSVRTWREAPRDYPKFSPDKEFKVELYFLTREGEGNYFYQKNQLSTPTAQSKAYDLTTSDDLSALAKLVAEKSTSLQGNVNRVTDRLAQTNFQVVTLSTLREMMKAFATPETLAGAELEGMANLAASFYDMLAAVRPELGVLAVQERRIIRDTLVVDAAVMMHGYAALMKDFNAELVKTGTTRATEGWRQRLSRLTSLNTYFIDGWSGDFFAKANPLWRRVGVVKPGRDGHKLTILNTGGARLECGRVLRQFLSVDPVPQNLDFLTQR